MKRIVVGWLAILALGGAARAADQAPERPAGFPRVELAPGSRPYYASVMLDMETNTIGYVCFDGNVSNGYERLYFWAPEDSVYRTPKAFRWNAETHRFGPVKFSPRHSKDDIKLDWSFGWSRAGGSFEHFDYVTGQTRKGGSAIFPRFHFYCDFARQPRSGSRNESLVDITMVGEIGASVWTNMPTPIQPWRLLNYYMGVKLVRTKEATVAHFDGRLNYGTGRCEVRALPRDTVCTLIVAPYLGQPVYSNDMSWSEAVIKGVDVKLDYGWYDLSWNMTCPGLRVTSRLDAQVRPTPFPVTRFDD